MSTVQCQALKKHLEQLLAHREYLEVSNHNITEANNLHCYYVYLFFGTYLRLRGEGS